MPSETEALAELDAAWDALLQGLGAARAAMKDPACFPPPPTDRNNAEGYRYLLGHLHRLIETELQQDADFPYIQHHPGLVGKYTIDNADCSYLYAPIRPDAYYRFSGRVAGDRTHWRGARRAAAAYAPNYVIVEAHTVAPGDSGGIEELFDGSRVITDKLDSKALQVEADGRFEVLIGPERPAGHGGNFIASLARQGSVLPRGDVARADMHARRLYVRELFGDWAREQPLEDLFIERVGFEGRYPKPRNAADTAAQLRRLGLLVKNQMRYWNTMYGRLLDPFEQQRDRPGPGFLPVNALAQPQPNRTERGGGQATNVMTGGLFRLADDEALLVEFRLGAEPEHLGFHLGNWWGESLDFANHVSSLNHLQSHRSTDGAYRYVVSRRDPGIQNWLDTTGQPGGYLTVRFTFPQTPPPEDFPRVATRLLGLDALRAALPADTPAFGAAQRIEQIRVRQRHVARRYRQY